MNILHYFSKDVIIAYTLIRELVGVNTPFNPFEYGDDFLEDLGMVIDAGLAEIINGGPFCPSIYILIPLEDLTIAEVRRNEGY